MPEAPLHFIAQLRVSARNPLACQAELGSGFGFRNAVTPALPGPLDAQTSRRHFLIQGGDDFARIHGDFERFNSIRGNRRLGNNRIRRNADWDAQQMGCRGGSHFVEYIVVWVWGRGMHVGTHFAHLRLLIDIGVFSHGTVAEGDDAVPIIRDRIWPIGIVEPLDFRDSLDAMWRSIIAFIEGGMASSLR